MLENSIVILVFISILIKETTRLYLQQFCNLQKSVDAQLSLCSFNAADIVCIQVCANRQLLLSPSFLHSEAAHVIPNDPVHIHECKIALFSENVIPTVRRYSERTAYWVVFLINNIIGLPDIFKGGKL